MSKTNLKSLSLGLPKYLSWIPSDKCLSLLKNYLNLNIKGTRLDSLYIKDLDLLFSYGEEKEGWLEWAACNQEMPKISIKGTSTSFMEECAKLSPNCGSIIYLEVKKEDLSSIKKEYQFKEEPVLGLSPYKVVKGVLHSVDPNSLLSLQVGIPKEYKKIEAKGAPASDYEALFIKVLEGLTSQK